MLLARSLVAGRRGGGIAKGRSLWARVVVTLALTALCACSATSAGPPPGTASPGRTGSRLAGRPAALVYRGPASCPGCSEAAAALIRLSPLHFTVSYVGPGEKLKITAASLRGAALYAQPGGDGSVRHGMTALGPAAAAAIRSYVAAGGHYLGLCMGAYLAGSDPGMGLLAPGDTGEYDQTRGALVRTAAQAVIPVSWSGAISYQYAQDPPYIIPSGVRGEKVLARFTNHRVDALVRPYRRGAVGVVGTHPEADRTWFTPVMWRAAKDGFSYPEGLQLIAALMRL
jgi:biotin protein ligase-like protein